MTNLLIGMCIGVIAAGMFVEFYVPAKVIYKCTDEEKTSAIISKLALIIDGDKLIYAPTPRRKPR